MATSLKIFRDAQMFPTSGTTMCLNFSNLNQTVALTQNVVESLTVPINPSSILMAHFSYTSGANVMVSNAASPAVVIPGVLAQTLSELNPVNRVVQVGSTIQLLTNQANVYVTISYYELQDK